MGDQRRWYVYAAYKHWKQAQELRVQNITRELQSRIKQIEVMKGNCDTTISILPVCNVKLDQVSHANDSVVCLRETNVKLAHLGWYSNHNNAYLREIHLQVLVINVSSAGGHLGLNIVYLNWTPPVLRTLQVAGHSRPIHAVWTRIPNLPAVGVSVHPERLLIA